MLTLEQVTLRRGTLAVLQQANATLHPGEKIGLVGRNGSGKTSLFALLQGQLHEDAGRVNLPSSWRITSVAQTLPNVAPPASDFVLEGDAALQQVAQHMQHAQQVNDGNALALAHTAWADAGGYDAHARAQSLLLGLGFTLEQLNHPVNAFSGGWRMRLQLARALMSPAELLLLDEPTNHLDLDAVLWLEQWLRRFGGTMVVISHDREFLDAVTTGIWHLSHGQLTRYSGGYSDFEEQLAARQAQQSAAHTRQQAHAARLQAFIDRFRAKATKARQAQSRAKALARMQRVPPVQFEHDLNFDFPAVQRLPTELLSLREAALGYSQSTPVLPNVSCRFEPGMRLGVLGANGQGKSTLIKTLAGVLPLLNGHRHQARDIRLGYFAQHEMDLLRPDDHALQHLARLAREEGADGKEGLLRGHLGQFGFADDKVFQPVGSLSGGERARLVLALLVWRKPQVLLLDEPTNHLDMAMRQALLDALQSFDGTVVLVSHDRALLRSVCDTFWLVQQHRVMPFDGDLEDYQALVLQTGKATASTAEPNTRSAVGPASEHGAPQPAQASPMAEAGSRADQRREKAAQRSQLARAVKPFEKQANQAQATLDALQAERAQIEQALLEPLPTDTLVAHNKRLKALSDEEKQAEDDWLHAMASIEKIKAEAGAS
ncbi:MAG: ATP-binding cassette domain-containing protein [Burkholderiaceae bacterium]